MYGSPGAGPAAYKDAIFLSPHKFIGGPGTPGRARRAARAADQPGAGRPRRRHRRLRQPDGAPLPRRPGAPRGGRHPGDHRVHPRRAGLPAQAGGRRRRHPRARGALPPARGAGVAAGAGDRDPRQPRRGAAVDRLVRRPRAQRRRPLPAPQLRRRRAQRPVRHPVPRRLLLRRPLRPPAARHRHRALATSSSARSRHGCEGIKPGWVRVNFNYFISEAVFDYVVEAVRLVAREGWRLLRRLPLRPGDRTAGTTAVARSSRHCACPRWATTPTVR